MSFKYRGVSISLNNYLDVFKDYEPDIQDEVRSAILDDTPIGQFIRPCGNDSYKLGQLRLAMREYVPTKYLRVTLSGKCINLIRKCVKHGMDLSLLLPYLDSNVKIEDACMESILKVMYVGGDIRKVDFTTVPKGNIDIICEGLIKGYPMWLCVSNEGYLTTSFIRQLMKGMQLHIDIHPFLNGLWTEEQLILILSNARSVDISSLLEYVNYKFSVDHLVEIIDAARGGYAFSLLCLQDDEGAPAFNAYQLAILRRALAEDVLDDELYNPNINDMDMSDILDRLLERKAKMRKPVLSGSLKKH